MPVTEDPRVAGQDPPSNDDDDRIMSRLKHRVYRYKVALAALGLFIIGLFFITLAAFIPASEADPVWSQVRILDKR